MSRDTTTPLEQLRYWWEKASPKEQRTFTQDIRGSIAARTAGSRLYFQIARLLSEEFDALSPEDQQEFLGFMDQALADLRAQR